MDRGLWERILGEERDTSALEGEAGNDPGQERRAKPFIGWISCVVGVVLGVGMVFAALLGGGANISAGALGVGFAVLGYFLGARRLATATIFLCVAAILFGLAASQGLIPSIAPSDRALPSISASQHAQALRPSLVSTAPLAPCQHAQAFQAFACQPRLSRKLTS